MEWDKIVKTVTPHIVQIDTPSGHGTGFLCLYSENRSLFGIATALHVVSHAHEWQQPIRLHHYPSSTTMFVKPEAPNRVIFTSPDTDSAVILVKAGTLTLPDNPLPLLARSSALQIGSEVGWLGFPALAPSTLCFFQGSISASQDHGYLIDGVAINGVSGGPVFFHKDDVVSTIGIISAYRPNWATGDALPGLSIARDVSHFHNVIKALHTLEEAAAEQKKQEEEQARKPQPSAPAPDSAVDKVLGSRS